MRNNYENGIENINMDKLIDIRDIRMEEGLDRAKRIEELKRFSNNGYVKYGNVLIKLEFESIYNEDICHEMENVYE